MRARIVGKVPLDESVSAKEIADILTLPYNGEYDDFVFGYWKNTVPFNSAGSHPERISFLGALQL